MPRVVGHRGHLHSERELLWRLRAAPRWASSSWTSMSTTTIWQKRGDAKQRVTQEEPPVLQCSAIVDVPRCLDTQAQEVSSGLAVTSRTFAAVIRDADEPCSSEFFICASIVFHNITSEYHTAFLFLERRREEGELLLQLRALEAAQVHQCSKMNSPLLRCCLFDDLFLALDVRDLPCRQLFKLSITCGFRICDFPFLAYG